MTATRMVLIAGAAAVLGFGIGFGWQFARAHRLERELVRVERELAFARLEGTLGAAALSAHRGQYDVALQLTSEFFTTLQQRLAHAPPEAREELEAILAQRDATIAAISRRDPTVGDLLARLFVRFRVAIGGPDQALPFAATPPGGAG